MIVFTCTCGKPLRAKPETAGKRTKCPHCNAVLTVPGSPPKPQLQTAAVGGPGASSMAPSPSSSSISIDPNAVFVDLDWSSMDIPIVHSVEHRPPTDQVRVDSSHHVTAPEVSRPAYGPRQYRVLAQKDQGFAGKFSATRLEETLNQLAAQGWTVKAATTVTMQGPGGDHDEMIIILER